MQVEGELSERNVVRFGFDYLELLFTLMNGKLIQNHALPLSPFMSSLQGCFISIYFLYQNKFTADFLLALITGSHVDFSLHLHIMLYGFCKSDEKN
jgi:hypothetical protein